VIAVRLRVLLFLSLLWALSAPAQAQRILSVPNVSTTPGARVKVNIQLNDGSGVSSVQFKLIYPASMLTPVGAPEKGSLLTDPSVTSNTSTAGTASIAVVSLALQSFNSGAGTVVAVNFQRFVADDNFEPGGVITSSGFYTAPSNTANVTITATSVSDPARSGSARVTVISTATGQVEKLYFAHFGNGSQPGFSLFSEIALSPVAAGSPSQAALEINDNPGDPLFLSLNGIAVVTSDAKLSGVILFGGSLGLTGVADSKPLRKFVASMRTTAGINTGVAMMGLGQDQTVQLELRNQHGAVVARASLQLNAKAHVAKLVDQFDWDTPVNFSSFSGNLTATGTADLAATVILVTPAGFATQPVAEVP
jgi:hypothetical protein